MWNTSNVTTGMIATEVHFEGTNYAFADGHVEWLKSVTHNGVLKPQYIDFDYNGDGLVGDANAFVWR